MPDFFAKCLHLIRAALKPRWVTFLLFLTATQLPWLLQKEYKTDILKPEVTEQQFGIADLIDKVRTDLRASHERMVNEKQGAMFVVKSFDLEVNFVVKKSAKAEGKFEPEVITIGDTRETSGERTQKITLHMEQYTPPPENPPDRSVPTSEPKKNNHKDTRATKPPNQSGTSKGQS